ncbi:MAG: Lrp/AsnC ligand binding domain-containing protein [Candidatus Bathyarchaeota archaeon]|nr:Lrp/AsnC ligand binding domain-containing protein [Candidatus Bathyarchaeota archaeon]
MIEAYVLLNTEIGREKQVLNALKRVDGVKEAQCLWGVYDILVNVKADDLETLKNIINNSIDKIGKINSKLTMIISQSPPIAKEQYLMFEPIQLTH